MIGGPGSLRYNSARRTTLVSLHGSKVAIAVNVLLTCAGRRHYLVRFFQEALGSNGQVIAVDCSPFAPALAQADIWYTVPRVSEPDYVSRLIDICQRHQVRLLIPLNDLELAILAAARREFLNVGTIPVVSSPEVIDICLDKLATRDFLKAHSVLVPETYTTLEDAKAGLDSGVVDFPLIVKPRWGTASIGVEIVEDWDELCMAYSLAVRRLPRTIVGGLSSRDLDRAILIQTKLRGEEYGLDIVNDLHGRYVTTFARRKLAMRSGETDRAVTVVDPELSHLGMVIGNALGHIGNLDCDVFRTDYGYVALELNPRFGGGYPFSHMAGANLPAVLIAWVEGRSADERWLRIRSGVTSSKYDSLVTMSEQELPLSQSRLT